MLIEFLMTEGNAEANYLRPLLNDLHGLFALLNVIHLEQNNIKDFDLAA